MNPEETEPTCDDVLGMVARSLERDNDFNCTVDKWSSTATVHWRVYFHCFAGVENPTIPMVSGIEFC